MNKLFEEEVIVDENERLLDTLKFLTEIEREDGEKEDTWAWLDSAMDFEGRTEEELIKFCQDHGFKVFRVVGDGETAGGLVAAGASVTPEQIQAEYADFYEVKPEVTEIEAEKKNESLKENFKSRKLHEGTANFRSQDAFDMYAIDDKEAVGFEDWSDEEKEDYENGDYNYFEACAYEYIQDLDRLTDELTEQLEYFTITHKGGYYSGIQSYVFPNCNRNTGRDYENDNIEDAIYDLAYDFEYYDGMSEEEADKKARELINAEVEKINKELLPRLKEVGMYKIAVSARFSNGETWYSKVEENLKEGFRGCPDIEMIWHGETNDPELEYKGVTFNYWDVEDALWQDFIDEHPEFYGAEGEKEIEAEDEFNQYCRERAASMLDDWIAAKNEGLKEGKEDVYLTADFLGTDDEFYLFLNDIVSGEDDKNWEGVDEEEKQILLAAREFHGDFFEKCGNKEFKTYEEFLAALKAVYDEGDYPLLECNKTLKESLTKEEWLSTIEGLKAEIEKVENKYSQNNCEYILDREAENLPVEKYIVKPTNGKYKNFYTFTNEFFNVYVDGWYHNWSYGDERPAVFPRGYKAELERTIKNYCKDHNLYCELRKAYRATVGSMANTAAFLIAIQPETKLDGGDILSDESLKEASNKNKFLNTVEKLAKKAARDYDRMSEEERADCRDEGTSVCFEEYPDLYNLILEAADNFTPEELEEAGIDVSADKEDINEEAFWILDDAFWEHVKSVDESLKEAKNPFSMSKEELEAEHKRLKDEMSKIRAKNPTSNYLKDLQARLDKIAKAHAKYGKFEESKKEKELLITPDYKGINSDGTTTDLGASE